MADVDCAGDLLGPKVLDAEVRSELESASSAERLSGLVGKAL